MTPYTKQIVELHKIHKAIENKECNGGGNTPSGDIGYEEIYQFYKKQLLENFPQEVLNTCIIPETFNDIEVGIGNSYENGQLGIWSNPSDKINEISNQSIIFFYHLPNDGPSTFIYFGEYIQSSD